MTKFTDTITRLSYIISLLTSEDYQDEDENPTLSINKLHKISGIPKDVLLNDVIALTESDFFYDGIRFRDDDKIDYGVYDFKYALITHKKSACDTPFFIDKSIFDKISNSSSKYMVLLDPTEKIIISKVLKKDFAGAVKIKESPFSPSEEDRALQDKIRLAIENKHPISFSYVNSDDEQIDYNEYDAHLIFETIDDGSLYVIKINDDNTLDLKRLDRMSNFSIANNRKLSSYNKNALKRLDYMWGADGAKSDSTKKSLTDEAVKVKLLIEESTRNIIPKIKSETSRRKYGKLVKDKKSENTWIYTDKVLGMNSFKRWLRKYGSSVLVLEPKWLAQEMYESALRKLENYKNITP